MNLYISIFIAGGLGSLMRYLLSTTVSEAIEIPFPWGTLVVNIIGSFLIGLLLPLLASRFPSEPSFQIILIAGFLGGFTTFSSFSWETLNLLQQSIYTGLLNIAAHVVLGLMAACFGLWLSRAFQA